MKNKVEKHITDAFIDIPNCGPCEFNDKLFKKYWNDHCYIQKFGGEETYHVMENISRDEYSSLCISKENALRLIKEMNLKEILPPWEGDARRYVSKNTSDNWGNR